MVVVATARATALWSEVLWGYITHLDNLYIEIQGLARHWVVEVHDDSLLFNLLDNTVHTVSFGIAHRYYIAHEQHLLDNLAVDHKDCLWQLHDSLGDNLAVTIFWFQSERNLIARLLADKCALEFREQHTCTANKFERLSLRILICHLSINGESIVHRNKFCVFYLHTLYK